MAKALENSMIGPSEFPLSRVKTIMYSAPEIKDVSQESLFLVSKATELFIKFMAEKAYTQGGNSGILEYKHLSELVQNDENFSFLKDIVPKKRRICDIAEQVKSMELANLMSLDIFPSSDEEMTPPGPIPSTSSETRTLRPRKRSNK